MTLRQRTPRLLCSGYLKWLRDLPCACGCGRPAPSDAAHLRAGVTGGGRKPDDMEAIPLNHGCHMRQHAYGDEAAWFAAHGIKDPKALAKRYYARYRRENPNAPEPYVRKTRPVKARKPRSQRQKIKGRGFPKKPRTLERFPKGFIQ